MALINVPLCLSIVLLCLPVAEGLLVIGCPIFGCRPSASFSFLLNVPKKNASVAWVSEFFCGPVPNALGCVGNDVNLVCQSNGPGPHDVGYVNIDTGNGTVRWRDTVLRFPTLPMMTNFGDITGTDGNNLVRYEYDGKLDPVISLEGSIRPVFSLQLVGTTYLLIVSERGMIAVRDTNGIPDSSMYLTGQVDRTNGTFLPVAQPVVNGNRFYLLTEFVPEEDSLVGILNMRRLYALDVHDRLADRVTVAWYFNFERLGKSSEDSEKDATLRFKSKKRSLSRHQVLQKQRDAMPEPVLLWNYAAETVFVSLPPPLSINGVRRSHASKKNVFRTFWGIKDSGTSGDMVFTSDQAVDHMAVFEPDSDDSMTPQPNAGAQLWVTQPGGKISAISPNGNISKVIDLAVILKTNVEITSKLVTARENNTAEDMLVMGINVLQTTPEFQAVQQKMGLQANNTGTHYVIAIDSPINATNMGTLLFMLPTPDDTEVKGQIVGIPGASQQRKDQLVFFAQTDGKFGKFFSVN